MVLLRQVKSLSVVLAGLLLTGVASLPSVASADTAPVPPTAATVSADPLPTAQVDGVVYTQVVVGNTVYAGGRFSTARPAGAAPGTGTVTRNNLMAYDVRTGELIRSFAPDLNSQVLSVAASPDGSRLYVAGEFTRANGQNRYRVAAYDIATGALVTSWAPTLDFRARALAVTADAVYVGGAFSSANGRARSRLAAFSPASGALLNWAPAADHQVMALVMTPDRSKVVAAGQFANLGGAPAVGMGALDAITGLPQTWSGNTVLRNSGDKAAINSLSTDGTKIYGTGYVFGAGGNIEGSLALDPADGSLVWLEDCHGDSYSGFAVGGAFYQVGHMHYCGNVGGFRETTPRSYSYALAWTTQATQKVARNTEGNYANFDGKPAPSLLHWYPRLDAGTFTGQGQAGWSITGTSDYVVVGGEFPKAGGTPQQGLVRYAVRSKAPNQTGPEEDGAELNPTLLSRPDGVRVLWRANWDRDNERLRYRLVRDNDIANPIYETQQASRHWDRPLMSFTDTTAVVGRTYSYRLYVSDPLENTAMSENVKGARTPATAYASTVAADAPALHWRLSERSGSYALDSAKDRDGLMQAGVTKGVAGPLAETGDTAVRMSGTATGAIASLAKAPSPARFSTEVWFRTTSTTGGKLMGYGSAPTGSSSSYDRHVYMDNTGKLTFGVYTGSTVTATSPASYNDGRWHQAVSSLTAEGIVLYVDGQRVAEKASTAAVRSFDGYWRLGSDNLSGWANAGTSASFAGDLDEFSVYPAPLSDERVREHFLQGTGAAQAPNQPPAAAFSASTTGLSVAVDAGASSDPEGGALSYAWDFGTGAAATGRTASHTYGSAGTYPVRLTVTDPQGATASTTKQVSVSAPAPNQPPAAAFSASTTGLSVAVDAGASSDPEGGALSYAWDFGTGATATGRTASHTYGSAGTYPVRLTVTDPQGATASTTKQVTVTAPQPPPPPAGPVALASDTFTREVASGFGASDKGGTWVLSGGASSFAVNGGAGRITMASPGSGPATWLDALNVADSDTRVSLSVDKPATGGGTYLSLVSRRSSSADNYRFKLRLVPGGSVTAYLLRRTGNAETTLQQVTVPGLTYTPGQALNLRLKVSGSSPTTLSAKVWSGASEPSGWLLTATDATAALQGTGSVGLDTYLSGSATGAPVTATWDDLRVDAP